MSLRYCFDRFALILAVLSLPQTQLIYHGERNWELRNKFGNRCAVSLWESIACWLETFSYQRRVSLLSTRHVR
jgi:hypothetical protein